MDNISNLYVDVICTTTDSASLIILVDYLYLAVIEDNYIRLASNALLYHIENSSFHFKIKSFN